MDSTFNDIMGSVNELANKIRNSEVYKNYLELKDKISNDSEIKYSIIKFRHSQLEYENKILNNVQPDFSEEQYISKLYSDLMIIEDVKKFFKVEKELIYIIKEVNDKILGVFDINPSTKKLG